MKSIIFVILIIAAILFLTTSGEYREESDIQHVDTPKKTYLDTPINTYEQRVEAQNIANTLTPSSSYIGSRIDARGDAKDSVQQTNSQMESREKAIEAFTKP